jgi:hypothetical protein
LKTFFFNKLLPFFYGPGVFLCTRVLFKDFIITLWSGMQETSLEVLDFLSRVPPHMLAEKAEVSDIAIRKVLVA